MANNSKAKLSDLTPDDRNANKGTQRGTGVIEDSLRKYGAGRSILIDRNGKIIAGNKTAEAAASIGLENVRIIETDGHEIVAVKRTDLDLDSKEARELAIADNRAGELNLDWDVDALTALEAEGVDLDGLFYEDELQALIDDAAAEREPKAAPEAQLDRAEELRAQWGTERGQVWQVGPHRLMCGDSTDAGDVARLMDGAKAAMVFTDPPYNVGKDYEGEDLSPEAFEEFHRKWIAEMEKTVSPDSAIYICFGARWMFEFADILRKTVAKPRLLIWYKPDSHGVGGGDFFYNYEAIFYGTRSGAFVTRCYDGQARDVWVINKAKESAGGFEHSTVKPIGVPSAAIETSSEGGQSVTDFFLGSGTTMVAAEQLGRVCYGMEIEPRYVAVALQRMADMGLSPERI